MDRTILVVDDNEGYRGMLATLLSERGYRVISAAGGAEGLALLAAHPEVDAVLTDYDMPGMDGFDFCQQLRAARVGIGPEIPVWIMTGALRPGLSRRGSAVGATLVVRKPFNLADVTAQFERAFQSRPQPGPETAGP